MEKGCGKMGEKMLRSGSPTINNRKGKMELTKRGEKIVEQ